VRPADPAVQRFSRIAWAAAALAGGAALASAALGLCATPSLVSSLWPMIDRYGHPNDGFAALIRWLAVSIGPACLGVTATVLVVSKIVLACCGFAWLRATRAERRFEMTAERASAVADLALGRLHEIGFKADPVQRNASGGWILRARLERSKRSPHPRGQSVEMSHAAGALAVIHRFEGRRVWWDRGHGRHQEWMIERLASGEPLDRSPGLLSLGAVVSLPMHFLDDTRREWLAARFLPVVGTSFLLSAAAVLLQLAAARRPHFSIHLGPALTVMAYGFALFARDHWQEDAWRTTQDPDVLVRAGGSASRDTPFEVSLSRISPRDRAAVGARLEAERRIRSLGSRCGPALVRLLTAGHSAAWARVMLLALEREAIPALLDACESPDARLRVTAIGLLAYFDEPAAARAVAARLDDPDDLVRIMAAGYFGRNPTADPDTLRALVARLQDRTARPRKLAANALGEARHAPALGTLLELLVADPRVEYARAAVRIGRVRDSKAPRAGGERERARGLGARKIPTRRPGRRPRRPGSEPRLGPGRLPGSSGEARRSAG
jgi:hypothetical protein